MGYLKYLLPLIFVSACTSEPEHLVVVPWVFSGKPMIIDTHTHTKYSDGSLSVEELVRKSVFNGCNAIVISDHSDKSLKAVSREFFADLDISRKKYPEIVVLSGLEWNVPPYKEREHVNLIVTPDLEQKLLPEFRRSFEDGLSANSGLLWIEKNITRLDDAVFIYNHPSRKAQTQREIYADMRNWHSASSLMTSFEGGPGHQKKLGDYNTKFSTIDRWDPVAGEIGGTWDMMLADGYNLWAALATSDYHNQNLDYYPCEFARIHANVPEKSARGILQAIKAGSFWADHGRLLNRFDFYVSTPGLDYPATPGETIFMQSDAELTVSIELQVDKNIELKDISAELIGNCQSSETQSLKIAAIKEKKSRITWSLTRLARGSDGESCFLRARIRKKMQEGTPDLLAYSNPIRIKL